MEAVGKARYLATLLDRIERHKAYPRVARRRNLEGRVEVVFEVSCNGSISGLAVSKGHGILQKSARRAVQQALPLPPPPAGIECPARIEFGMLFELR